jgi:Concanavalin A-like lectin/glucanases superfamily/PEP-CTERM motif
MKASFTKRSHCPLPTFASKSTTVGLLFIGILLGIPVSSQAIYSPPANGLVSWWTGDGNGNDSANGHNGVVGSGVDFVPGINNQAFNFTQAGANAGTSRVYVPDDNAFKLTGSLSIAAWVKGDTHSWTILLRGDNRSGLDPYGFGFSPNGHLGFTVTAGPSSYTSLEVPTFLPDNVWMHVAATLDDATGDMRIYVNGVVSAETFTSDRPFADLDPGQEPSLGIGNVSGHFYNFPFVGQIDEVLLYSRALSQAEITALVPEPSTFAVAGLGGAALLTFRRRKIYLK